MATAKILLARERSKSTLQIKTRLSRLGYRVTGTVSTIPAIFKSITRRLPDVLLLDLSVRNGGHTIKAAREIRSSFDIPVVLLAGQFRSTTPLLISDPFEIVYKPFRSEELHTAIEMALFKHSLKQQTGGPAPAPALVPLENISQKSGELFSKAFHANPSGMIITRLADGKILDVNASCQRFLGYTAGELIGNTGLSLNIQNPEEYQAIMSRLQWDGWIRNYETSLRTKSGGWVHVLLFLERIELDGEQCILASIYDITERKKAEETLHARERFLALLNDMTKTTLLSKDIYTTLSLLAVDMAKLLHADDCYITRWDAALNEVIPTTTTAKLERPFSEFEFGSGEINMTLSVLQAGHALAADDVRNSPHINQCKLKDLHIQSMLGIPLIAGEHKLGAALITFNAPHPFTPEEIARAEQAGNQIALALWNFQQGTEIEQRLKEGNALAEIGRALSKTERVGTGKVLQLIVDSARDLIPQAEKSVIHLLDTEQNLLIAQAVSGFHKGWGKEHIKMRLGEGVAGKVIREGITINVRDIRDNPNFLFKASNPPEFQSLLVAPVQSGGSRPARSAYKVKTHMPFLTRMLNCSMHWVSRPRSPSRIPTCSRRSSSISGKWMPSIERVRSWHPRWMPIN